MKGRDLAQMGVGTLAGILLGVGVTTAIVYPRAYNKGHNEGWIEGQGVGFKQGAQEGLEEGLTKGKSEGFAGAGIFEHAQPIYDAEGNLLYGSIDIMFGGYKYEDYSKGRMTPADARIICDLRGISQPLVDRNVYTVFNKRNLLNLVWNNGLPEGAVRVYITERDKKLWEAEIDPEKGPNDVQKRMYKCIPPATKYSIVIVPEGSLAKVDYASQFLNERKAQTGYEFTPEQVRLSDKLPASEEK